MISMLSLSSVRAGSACLLLFFPLFFPFRVLVRSASEVSACSVLRLARFFRGELVAVVVPAHFLDKLFVIGHSRIGGEGVEYYWGQSEGTEMLVDNDQSVDFACT